MRGFSHSRVRRDVTVWVRSMVACNGPGHPRGGHLDALPLGGCLLGRGRRWHPEVTEGGRQVRASAARRALRRCAAAGSAAMVVELGSATGGAEDDAEPAAALGVPRHDVKVPVAGVAVQARAHQAAIDVEVLAVPDPPDTPVQPVIQREGRVDARGIVRVSQYCCETRSQVRSSSHGVIGSGHQRRVLSASGRDIAGACEGPGDKASSEEPGAPAGPDGAPRHRVRGRR